MTPFETARTVYASEPCARLFEQDLLLHYLHGFVFSTPEYFIMGRPVWREGPLDQIINPAVTFPRDICDCWHIYLLAGNPARAWAIMPWMLPWFSFERRNELRFYPVDRIKRLSLADALNSP